MRAVTFQAPGEVRIDEKPDPELTARRRGDRPGRGQRRLRLGPPHLPRPGRDRARASRSATSTSARSSRSATASNRSPSGDRVLGTYCTACGECFFCARGDFHKCDNGRVFGHGKLLGELQGAQAELLLVPERRPHPAQGPRGDDRRRRAVRRRRDGHRLPRGRRDRRRRGRRRRRARARPGRPLRRPGGDRGRRRAGDRDRHRRRAARDGALVRRRARAPDRGGPEGGGQGRDRGPRRRRGDRRRRPSGGVRPRLPADPQVRRRSPRPASTPSGWRSTWASSGSRR